MIFALGYVLAGGLFLGSAVGYWLVTRALRDPETSHEPAAPATPAGGGT